MGLGVVGLELQCRAEFGLGVGRLALVMQGIAEVVVGLGEVGLELQRRAVFGHRPRPACPGRRALPRL